MEKPSTKAPVALFIYNRPDHTLKTIRALLQCPEANTSPFYVFSDGAKDAEGLEKVQETRRVAENMLPDHAQMICSDINKGLATSIEDGVSYLSEKYGSVIVLEDDLVVSTSFLRYMNSALKKYRNNKKVMQISGYMFPIEGVDETGRCVLLPICSSWGWATWDDAWRSYDPLAKGWELLGKDRELRNSFNINGALDYYSMLKSQMSGRSDSWAIRWYWSVFREKGLTVFPLKSLVDNIGFDGSGTHGWRTSRRTFKISDLLETDRFVFPEEGVCDEQIYKLVVEYLKRSRSLPQKYLGSAVKRCVNWCKGKGN